MESPPHRGRIHEKNVGDGAMKKKPPMGVKDHTSRKPEGTDLFDRVVSILEQARANTVRAINNNMVIAYWLIGREIVLEIQGGEERAEYGKQVIEGLSSQLKGKYSRGFSITNLRYFRTFYTVYSERRPEIRQIGSGELGTGGIRQSQSGVLGDMSLAVEKVDEVRGFSPQLGWSHYQVLMGVEIGMSGFSMKLRRKKRVGKLSTLNGKFTLFCLPVC
jgi:hypothetical protein